MAGSNLPVSSYSSRRIISVLTFLSVVMAVHFIWGWGDLLSFWKKIPLPQLMVFTLLYWMSYPIRSYRISVYFRSPSLTLPLKHVLFIVVKQTFWSNLLPAKTGEISFPILMKQVFKMSFTRSVPGLLVLRLFDAFVLGTMVLAVLIYAYIGYWAFAWLLISVFIPLAGIFLKSRLQRLVERHSQNRIARFVEKVLPGIPSHFGQLIHISVLSWINWGVKIFLLASLLASMTHLGILQTVIASILGEVSGMMPGLPGGFYSYEAAVAFGLFTSSDMPHLADSGMIAAALNAHFFILFQSILGAMILFLFPGQYVTEKGP